MKKKYIEILEDIQVGNILLEKGDRIKLINEEITDDEAEAWRLIINYVEELMEKDIDNYNGYISNPTVDDILKKSIERYIDDAVNKNPTPYPIDFVKKTIGSYRNSIDGKADKADVYRELSLKYNLE